MRMNKYAIRFPELGNMGPHSSLNIFSETSVLAAEGTFRKTFNVLDSLTGFVIQKNRTAEFGKQLIAQKRALDAEVDNNIEQLRIQNVEEAKRIQIKIEKEKQKMDFELQKLKIEIAERAKSFSFSYEEYMKSNKVFFGIITREKYFLEEIQSFIEGLGDEYSNRKEYILCCDLERKSLELIDTYLKQMI